MYFYTATCEIPHVNFIPDTKYLGATWHNEYENVSERGGTNALWCMQKDNKHTHTRV